MNEKNLYYKRGLYIINKLLKTFYNDTTFYKNRLDFFKIELQRMSNNKNIVDKDFNSFYITSLVSLIGLNKENIENINKHNDYNLSEINKIRDMSVLNDIKKYYPEFDRDRKIQTKFDNWLSVETCDYPTSCYMMNIRNGLLHSEYEPIGEFGDLISIKNSNYTNFNSKVILIGLLDFCELYFGNSGWLGLSEKLNVYVIDCDKLKTNPDTIDEALDTIEIKEINYKYEWENYKLPELKLYEELRKNNKNLPFEKKIKKLLGNNCDYSINTKKLNIEQKNIIKKMIEKYYGDSFYKMRLADQNLQLSLLTRYIYDSRMVISEWICDYIELINYINTIYFTAYRKNPKEAEKMIDEFNCEINQRSIFASRTSLLILKLYHILYRLQYKNYEEVDYNKINFDMTSDDYNYERKDKDGSISYDFNLDKVKMKLDYPNDSDNEIENRIVCEIIRDALCHGNMEMNFRIENDELKEYITFKDIYKGRVRKLEITLEKLEKFLTSDAFKVENCIVKDNSSKVKVIQ